MQLHCLLSSIKKYTNLSSRNINVLHRYDEKYSEGLKTLKEIHTDVNFIQEQNFEKQVKDYLMSGEKYCTFFVDDMIVKDDIDFNVPCNILESNESVLMFSLRLGTHLTHCYPVNSFQKVPNGNVNSDLQVFIWPWRDAQFDWNYPLSVDGHIFRRSDVSSWTTRLNFKNPNKFEESLQVIPRIFPLSDIGCSFLNSKVVNIPSNRVQNEILNRNEEESIDDSYESWMSGKEIDFDLIKGFLNKAAHHPLSIPTRSRKI